VVKSTECRSIYGLPLEGGVLMNEENERTTIHKAIQDFLNFHEMNKDSEGTIRNYQVLLGRFGSMSRVV
jgi:hypothetical protein